MKLIEIKFDTLSICSKFERFPVNVKKINKLRMKDNAKSIKKIMFNESFLPMKSKIFEIIISFHIYQEY